MFPKIFFVQKRDWADGRLYNEQSNENFKSLVQHLRNITRKYVGSG